MASAWYGKAGCTVSFCTLCQILITKADVEVVCDCLRKSQLPNAQLQLAASSNSMEVESAAHNPAKVQKFDAVGLDLQLYIDMHEPSIMPIPIVAYSFPWLVFIELTRRAVLIPTTTTTAIEIVWSLSLATAP